MTSIFDQYEEAFQKKSVLQVPEKPAQLSTSGFINVKMEDETPIFTKQKVNFAPTNTITHLVVGGNTIVLAMVNNVLLRINLDCPEVLEEISLSSNLINLFMESGGSYALAAVEGNEVYQILSGTKRPKNLSKLHGFYVTSMSWTQYGPTLVGTAKGDILETEIIYDSNPYIKQLFTVNKKIFDIHHVKSDLNEENTVLVSTLDRIYTFRGTVSKEKPMFSNFFLTYINKHNLESYIEEKNFLKFSKLQVLYSKDSGKPKLYAWYIDKGLFVQDFQEESSMSLIETSPGVINFILTDFHVLFLYPDHITGVSVLSKQVVFEDYYNESCGKLVDIVKETLKGRVWVIAEQAVFRYKVVKEDRHAWLMYSERGDWEKAKAFCKDNPANLDIVTQKQAESNFNSGSYEASALLWARTQASLEDIALKFLQVWQVDALRTFLKKKLERLRSEDKAQITMIVMWVMELYLYELGELRNSGQESSEQYRMLQVNLDIFLGLPQVTEFVRNHKTTVYELIASHGDKQNLIKLTIATKDYERNLRHLIQEEKYSQCLDVLCQQHNINLWYQFIPTLLQNNAKLTTEKIISHRIQLDASVVLSAIMSCPDHNVQIRFLEYCIHSGSCQTQSVHNYLLLLYARHKPDKLLDYLTIQGRDISMLNYDVHYALRTCRELGATEACVTLSCVLGLWEAAVDLALTISVDLAKETAMLPPVHQKELKRKLWLKIAQHVVSEKNDIKTALEFLDQSELISIEDILPFFSDFTCIDEFKQAICSSLEQYNQHILDLKEEMNEATRSAEEIRKDIHSCGNRYYKVQNTDTCNICNVQLLNNSFYIFPCGHKFHSHCIIEELGREKKTEVDDLHKSLQQNPNDDVKTNIKSRLDNLLAKECFFCGSHMVDAIDKPFINDEDIERISKEWE